MKLGIALIVIGAGDLVLSLTLGATGWPFPIRFVIDVGLIIWGVTRIRNHKKKQEA